MSATQNGTTASNNGNNSANNTASNTGSASQTGNSTSVFIPPQTAPAGLISFTQPPITATSFYKIASGEDITFGWTFQYVLVTPTHLTVSASCDNQNTYAVGPTDGIIDGTATTVVWDIYSYQTAHPETPLAQGTCTLGIWDERGPDATRQPGYLQPTSGLKFALYSPAGYTAIASGWSCPQCNSGIANKVTHPAVVSLVAMFLVMFFSGFHLLRRR